MNMRLLAGFTFACAPILAVGVAEAGLEKQGSSSTEFTAVGPAGFRIVGTTADLRVSGSPAELTITVPLGNLTTGISLRDSHMREKYLEVPAYPNAELTTDRSALHMPTDGAASDATIDGTLQLHGQKRPVQVHYHATRSGHAIAISGTFRINMNNFGIQVPSYLGVTVKPEVEVTARFVVAES